MSSDIRPLGLSDTLFKLIFTGPDKSILCEYINYICNLDLEADKIEMNPIEIKDKEMGRGVRFDIRFSEINGQKYTHANFEAQIKVPNKKSFENRKIYYASSLFKDGFREGEDFSKDVYSRTIFFMFYDKDLKGNPIKRTILHEVNDDVNYDQFEIVEIYIRNLIEMDVETLTDYDKIIREMTSVLVDSNYQKYLESSIPVVRKVANTMAGYTKEEIEQIREEMQREYDFEQERLKQAYIKDALLKHNVELVLNMHQLGLTNDDIAKCLKLSQKDVEEILQKNQ